MYIPTRRSIALISKSSALTGGAAAFFSFFAFSPAFGAGTGGAGTPHLQPGPHVHVAPQVQNSFPQGLAKGEVSNSAIKLSRLSKAVFFAILSAVRCQVWV